MILLWKWKEIAVLLSYALLGFEPKFNLFEEKKCM